MTQHPLSIDVVALGAAGFQLDTRPRPCTDREHMMTWPLAQVPNSSYAPQLIRVPSQTIPLSCEELNGRVFGQDGEELFIEIDEVYTSSQLPDRAAPGTIVGLDISAEDIPEFAGGPESIWRFVNSSLRTFARSHLAWQQAVLSSWDLALADDVDSDAEAIANAFVAQITAWDGHSPYWEDKAFQLADLGISPGVNWLTSWLEILDQDANPRR